MRCVAGGEQGSRIDEPQETRRLRLLATVEWLTSTKLARLPSLHQHISMSEVVTSSQQSVSAEGCHCSIQSKRGARVRLLVSASEQNFITKNLSNMEEAIKLAVEGGWIYEDYCDGNGCKDRHILLDPLFWQAIGRAMGWSEFTFVATLEGKEETWKYQWHALIDHLAEGKDPDSFFTTLISKK